MLDQPTSEHCPYGYGQVILKAANCHRFKIQFQNKGYILLNFKNTPGKHLKKQAPISEQSYYDYKYLKISLKMYYKSVSSWHTFCDLTLRVYVSTAWR